VKTAASIGLLVIAACLPLAAQAVVVLGTANPNLAGRASGYSCCTGDTAPAQSAVDAGIALVAGDQVQFFVTGSVANSPGGGSGNNPDGNSGLDMTNYGDGISSPLGVRFNALYGVFLDAQDPTGLLTPAQLDFAGNLAFMSLSPGLRQIFFIGDGLTSDSNAGLFDGTRQNFIVPTGATRLFLGTGDSFEWNNNSGTFNVGIEVLPAGQVALPPTLALVALAAFGIWPLSPVLRRPRAVLTPRH
jgi:hypothetical protein